MRSEVSVFFAPKNSMELLGVTVSMRGGGVTDERRISMWLTSTGFEVGISRQKLVRDVHEIKDFATSTSLFMSLSGGGPLPDLPAEATLLLMLFDPDHDNPLKMAALNKFAMLHSIVDVEDVRGSMTEDMRGWLETAAVLEHLHKGAQ